MKNFYLVISGTDLVNIQGISAAGKDTEALKYTATLDAEYVYAGKTFSKPELPISPSGIISPAYLSRKLIEKFSYEVKIINAGAFISPQIPHYDCVLKPSRSINSSNAIDLSEVNKIYESGKTYAKNQILEARAQNLALEEPIIIAESVVTGTTTALALMKGLGFDADRMVSSSFPDGNHDLKNKILGEGYKNFQALALDKLVKQDPLVAVSGLGDKMQAFVAGMSIEFIRNRVSVRLGGGTQMIAIAALIMKLSSSEDLRLRELAEKLDIGTTRWLIEDKSAKALELAKLVCPSIKIHYADIFHQNELDAGSMKENDPILYKALTAYNQGHVKEGVGMGALSLELLAFL
jgi:uncharacterized protein (TIGR00303 family)